MHVQVRASGRTQRTSRFSRWPKAKPSPRTQLMKCRAAFRLYFLTRCGVGMADANGPISDLDALHLGFIEVKQLRLEGGLKVKVRE
jgi:hypothetical protein